MWCAGLLLVAAMLPLLADGGTLRYRQAFPPVLAQEVGYLSPQELKPVAEKPEVKNYRFTRNGLPMPAPKMVIKDKSGKQVGTYQCQHG